MIDSTKNCREYCRLSRLCYAKGNAGQDPWECPNAWKIEDILMDDPGQENDDYEKEDTWE